MQYSKMNQNELKIEYDKVKRLYEEKKNEHFSFDMSRGKPEEGQLDFALEALNLLSTAEDCKTENGFDVRNYGLPTGLDELKEIFAEILSLSKEKIVLGGNSSLKLMYNVLVDAFLIGLPSSQTPWKNLKTIRFLCPVPGYDRHFTMCEHLGIEMIPVPMDENGPDMDLVEKLVSEDDSIKGIWCVPKYSNPTGITYSDETVRRLSKLKPKANDFCIFWDNAYFVHDLYDESDSLLNLQKEAAKWGNESHVFQFFSTSKITFAGAGVSMVSTSLENVSWLENSFANEGLGFDKINQLRHARYLKDKENVSAIMKKHAAILRPKFESVIEGFEEEFGDSEIAGWSKPRGGYFINLSMMNGCAKRTWKLAKEMGVILTQAGASYPYLKNPNDSDIRIAPSNVPLKDVKMIAKLVAICTKLAVLEKLLAIHS